MYLYLFPLIAALSGWLLNHLLLRYFLGKVLPAKAPAWAAAAGNYVSGTVLSPGRLASGLSDPAKLETLKPVIEQHIDVFLKEKLKEKMPAIAMFIGEKTIEMMKKSLLEEIDLLLPELLGRYAATLGNSLDLGKLLRQKLEAMPATELDGMIRKHLERELRLFRWYGALGGLVTGSILLCLALLAG